WLAHGTGRVAEFRAKFPLSGELARAVRNPVSALRDCGMADRLLLAHGNYLAGDQIAELARSECSVAYCPRAHRFFGHPPHPWREMLAAGINVCVGTDSLASNESLSILDELRFLRRMYPEVSARTLLEMGTIRAARALGLQGEVGAIE